MLKGWKPSVSQRRSGICPNRAAYIHTCSVWLQSCIHIHAAYGCRAAYINTRIWDVSWHMTHGSLRATSQHPPALLSPSSRVLSEKGGGATLVTCSTEQMNELMACWSLWMEGECTERSEQHILKSHMLDRLAAGNGPRAPEVLAPC